jgi:hypothetical protein
MVPFSNPVPMLRDAYSSSRRPRLVSGRERQNKERKRRWINAYHAAQMPIKCVSHRLGLLTLALLVAARALARRAALRKAAQLST